MHIAWECPEPLGLWQSYSMGASGGQVVQNVSGTPGLVGRKVGLVLEGPNVDFDCLYGVFMSIPLP